MKKLCMPLLLLFICLSSLSTYSEIAEASNSVYCAQCGREISSSSNYCMFCGYPVRRSNERKSGIVKVYAGPTYTLALRADGTIAAAGFNESDPGWNELSSWSEIKDIYIWDYYIMGLKQDGHLVLNYEDSIFQKEMYPPKGKTIVEATIGITGELVCLLSDGSVYTGQNGDPYGLGYPLWDNIQSIQIGSDSAFGVRQDGTVISSPEYMKRDLRFQEIAQWRNISSLSMGEGFVPVGLKRDGTVVDVKADPNDYHVPHDTSDWKDIIKICSQYNLTIGLRKDGKVFVTGGEWEKADFLREVSKWTDIVDISASTNHVVGLKADGTLISAGDNSYGQCKFSEWF